MPCRYQILIFVLSLILLVSLPGFAWAGDFPYTDHDSFDGNIETPSEFFGVPLGSRFTPHHDVARYLHHVAGTSGRAHLEVQGRSAEGRELFLLAISSPENIARLGEIERLQGLLADSRRLKSDVSRVIDDLPIVLWLSYNVHGNEASCTEAALQTIYHLVDGNDADIARIRENAVILIDPLLNPDGRERYLSWYQQVRSRAGNPDPDSREHDEPWPGGRGNHYYFDLNRDWAWASQPETKARIPHYLRWQPLVHVDFHEMSAESSYFFFPPADPIHPVVPESTIAWSEEIGKANAQAFDRFGWLYYTAEGFDLFYPSYGDSWPTLHGSIGMTYEQAGGGGGGIVYDRRDGRQLTLVDRLHHHTVAGLATVECAVDNKEKMQRSFHKFRSGSRVEGENLHYFFPPGQGELLDRFARLLLGQGIEISETTEEVTALGLHQYSGEEAQSSLLPRGTLVVSVADQPAGHLARALLEPRAEAQEAYFYDVSAWSLPLAMGVTGYTTAIPFDGGVRPLTAIERRRGSVVGEGKYGFLLPWHPNRAVKVLDALNEQELEVRLIPEKVVIEGTEFPPGTLFIPAGSDRVQPLVTTLAEKLGVDFTGINSGWTEEGIDLGSEKISVLSRSQIAVATGEGVSSLSFGAIWSLFENDLDIGFSAVELSSLLSSDLSGFDVLVLPSGRGYRRAFSEEGIGTLKEWVSDGGVLVAIGSAAFALAKEGLGLVSRSSAVEEDESEEEEEKVRRKIKELKARRQERQVPGNIFRVDLDSDHPLAFGMPQEIHVFHESTRSFEISGGGGDVGAFTFDPAASGFISEENIEKLAGRIYLAEERIGAGHVVLFAGDPNFRLFWHGLTGLFINSVFLL